MASEKSYLEYILDQLPQEEVSWRPMMGEYILYFRGKVIGGIYDNRFLVKPVRSACAILPDAPREIPYEGAGKMLMVEEAENRELMRDLLNAMAEELPEPKRRKKR